jgi:hypothetical protein
LIPIFISEKTAIANLPTPTKFTRNKNSLANNAGFPHDYAIILIF